MVFGSFGARSGFAALVFFCSSCLVPHPCAILVRQYGYSRFSQLWYFKVARRDAFAALTYTRSCRHNFVFCILYTPGRDNSAADVLSRWRLQEFRLLAPYADQLPCPIPPTLLSLLVPPGWSTSVYAAGQRAYFQFCFSFSLPYFPSSEWLLMLFATWFAQTGNLAPSSVSSYIAAVRSWHIDHGAPDPTSASGHVSVSYHPWIHPWSVVYMWEWYTAFPFHSECLGPAAGRFSKAAGIPGNYNYLRYIWTPPHVILQAARHIV